jgi:hypothetical protein
MISLADLFGFPSQFDATRSNAPMNMPIGPPWPGPLTSSPLPVVSRLTGTALHRGDIGPREPFTQVDTANWPPQTSTFESLLPPMRSPPQLSSGGILGGHPAVGETAPAMQRPGEFFANMRTGIHRRYNRPPSIRPPLGRLAGSLQFIRRHPSIQPQTSPFRHHKPAGRLPGCHSSLPKPEVTVSMQQESQMIQPSLLMLIQTRGSPMLSTQIAVRGAEAGGQVSRSPLQQKKSGG